MEEPCKRPSRNFKLKKIQNKLNQDILSVVFIFFQRLVLSNFISGGPLFKTMRSFDVFFLSNKTKS